MRTDKYKKVHNDKCKKELTPKLLQGDTIEHPNYILEKKLKIDYNYYLSHQIEKPVYQIFELVMKNPSSIIADLVRNMNNQKNNNHTIKDWLNVMGSKSKVEQEKEKADPLSIHKKIDEVFINNDDEEENMLGEQFEEVDIIEEIECLEENDGFDETSI
jgi:hypothetical protein